LSGSLLLRLVKGLCEPGIDGEVTDEEEGVGMFQALGIGGEGGLHFDAEVGLNLEQAQQFGWGQLAE
jgi:hypothetical protein